MRYRLLRHGTSIVCLKLQKKNQEAPQSQNGNRTVKNERVADQASMAERFSVKKSSISRDGISPELKARLDKIREKSPVTVLHWSKRAEELQEMVEYIDRTSISLRENSHPSVGNIQNLVHLLEISDA
ncbi:MAG: hypothetical protein HC845_04820, partial [Akkermansiaceae bacterium]|nr:hypothetical protein [Akkermansiaceae bacterium]